MAFSESVKDRAFARSKGRCECRSASHGHGTRCTHTVTRYNAVYRQALSVGPDIGGGVMDCEVLCQTCFLKSEPYLHPTAQGAGSHREQGDS